MKTTKTAILATLLCCASATGNAQDDLRAREAAVERYLAVVPLSSMLDDVLTEMSKQAPEAEREQFTALMRQILRPQSLERITRQSMVRVFTADEIDAMAEFYKSQHLVSAMKKFGVYMAEVMPSVEAEIVRSVQEIEASAAAGEAANR